MIISSKINSSLQFPSGSMGSIDMAEIIAKENRKKFDLAMMELHSLSEQANLRVDECQEKQQTVLDLSGCRVIDFSSDLLPFLMHVTELNLSNTSLQRLPSNLKLFSSLEILDLRGNPELNISIAYIRRELPKVKVLVDDRRVSPTSVSEPTDQSSMAQEGTAKRQRDGHSIDSPSEFHIQNTATPTSFENKKKFQKIYSPQKIKVNALDTFTTPVK